MKSDSNLQLVGINVQKIVRLNKQATITNAYSSLEQNIGDSVNIAVRKDDAILEFRDLNKMSIKKEVCGALRVELGAVIDVSAVKIIQMVYRAPKLLFLAAYEYCQEISGETTCAE